MVEYKIGNLLDAKENIIVHQVNHQGVMGAGLALQIKKKFPEAYKKYRQICDKLSWEEVQGGGAVDFYTLKDGFYVASLFGQRYYGKYHLSPDYGAMKNGFNTILRFATKSNLSVAIPYKIGCGLGNGDWFIVSKMIEDIFSNKIKVAIYKMEE